MTEKLVSSGYIFGDPESRAWGAWRVNEVWFGELLVEFDIVRLQHDNQRTDEA